MPKTDDTVYDEHQGQPPQLSPPNKPNTNNLDSTTSTTASTTKRHVPDTCDICFGFFIHTREWHRNQEPAKCIGMHTSIREFDKEEFEKNEKDITFDKLFKIEDLKNETPRSNPGPSEIHVIIIGLGFYLYSDNGIGPHSFFRTIFGTTRRVVGEKRSSNVPTLEMKKQRRERLEKELQEAREKAKLGILAERDLFDIPSGISLAEIRAKMKELAKGNVEAVALEELAAFKNRYVECSSRILYKIPEVVGDLPSSMGLMANRIAASVGMLVEKQIGLVKDHWKKKDKERRARRED